MDHQDRARLSHSHGRRLLGAASDAATIAPVTIMRMVLVMDAPQPFV